jgi:hyperosmotically inducible protein
MQHRGTIVACVTCIGIFGTPLAHAQTTPAVGGDTGSIMAQATKKQARADNRILSKAVRRSLAKTKGLDASAITVLSRDGKVSLIGSVPDTSQIELAGSAAGSVHGVRQVENRLVMREAGH